MMTAVPGWVEGLVEESFFVGCGSHESRKKNEKNIFCLRCCTSICTHCLSTHPSHPLIQVRRYVYNDVVRLDDLEKLIDCSYVQPYTINSAKVVFLKPRPQSRPFKGSGNVCLTCDRILQEPFHFCSLSCKVDHVVLQGQDVSSILFVSGSTATVSNFEGLRMDLVHGDDDDDDDDDDDGHTTPNSILEDYPMQQQQQQQYGGSSSRGNLDFELGETKNKIKKEEDFFPQLDLSPSNRRKGAPRRSPLS